MKKLIATVCVLGSTLALTACHSTGSGYTDTQAPYASERAAPYSATRTAGDVKAPVEVPKSAEPVMEKRVTK